MWEVLFLILDESHGKCETSSTSITVFTVCVTRSREELLQHANVDQVNAASELVLNLLKNNISVTSSITAQLHPYKKVLRNLGRRQHSVKKRRQWLVSQKGRGLWQGLNNVLCHVFDAKPSNVGEPFARRQSGTRGVERGMLLLEA